MRTRAQTPAFTMTFTQHARPLLTALSLSALLVVAPQCNDPAPASPAADTQPTAPSETTASASTTVALAASATRAAATAPRTPATAALHADRSRQRVLYLTTTAKIATLHLLDHTGVSTRIGELSSPVEPQPHIDVVVIGPGHEAVAFVWDHDLYVTTFNPPKLDRVTHIAPLLKGDYEAYINEILFRPDGAIALFRIDQGLANQAPYVDPPLPPGYDAGWNLVDIATGQRRALPTAEIALPVIAWSPSGEFVFSLNETTGGTTIHATAVLGAPFSWQAKVVGHGPTSDWRISPRAVWARNKSGVSAWDWHSQTATQRHFGTDQGSDAVWRGVVQRWGPRPVPALPSIPAADKPPPSAKCGSDSCEMFRLGSRSHVLVQGGELRMVRKGELGEVIGDVVTVLAVVRGR